MGKHVEFPLALIAPKLVMAYIEAYQEETRTIMDRDMNILVDLSTKSIGKAFHISTFGEMEKAIINDAKEKWDSDPVRCKRIINQYWFKEKRGSVAKVPQELYGNDFYEDYHNLVTLLSKVMGLPTIVYFQEWMFYFMEEILGGKAKFYWARIISNCLHKQFVVVKNTLRFYMTSYLVYFLVDRTQYRCLFRAPDKALGRELKFYDKYPQLQFRNLKRDYCIVNDAFIGHMIRLLGVDFERRVLYNANAFIIQFSFLFTQFLKFTYMHVEGFLEKPYKLPDIPMTRYFC